MAKDTKKENPLLSKNIPKPPAQEETRTEEGKTALYSREPQSSNTVILQSGKTVKQRRTVKREKITFYLEPDQSDKLYDLMDAFRKRTGVKINQQNMLRRILEVVDINTVLPQNGIGE